MEKAFKLTKNWKKYFTSSVGDLTQSLKQQLEGVYKLPTEQGKKYLLAGGELPVLLVAHLDTVHRYYPAGAQIKIDINKDSDIILSAPLVGLGADDRAGVWGVMEILRALKSKGNPLPSVLFTDEEETGGGGASEFTEAMKGISHGWQLAIELDRKGQMEAVYYCQSCERLKAFFAGHGFKESSGSFSDISIIGPGLQLPAVNLSIGYCKAHTPAETLNLTHARQTIKAVCDVLSQEIPADITCKITAPTIIDYTSYRGWNSRAWDDGAWEDDYINYYGGRKGRKQPTTKTGSAWTPGFNTLTFYSKIYPNVFIDCSDKDITSTGVMASEAKIIAETNKKRYERILNATLKALLLEDIREEEGRKFDRY